MADLTQNITSVFGVQVPHPHGTQVLEDVFPSLTCSPSPTSTPIDELRTRVETILAVFDDPRYARLDIPDWVHRATTHMPAGLGHHFSVRNLVRAMRDTAADLDLADGERYVLTAVCVCVDSARSTSAGAAGIDSPGNQGEEVARAVQHLASAWVAFLLWPFFARMWDRFNPSGLSSPCTGLAVARKAMAAVGELDPDSGVPLYPLRDQVHRRDDYKCVVSGFWDDMYLFSIQKRLPKEFFREGRPARVDCVRIFKHPLVVYKDVYDNDKLKHNSTVLSSELLRRYTQLSNKYTQDPMGSGVMDDPENNISLALMAHPKFDRFGFVFVPTQTPNTYQMKDLSPRFEGPDTLPDTVTFEDHSGGVADSDNINGQPVPPVGLPSRELLRTHAALGGALYASGVLDIFDRLLNFRGEKRRDVGDLPLPTPDGMSFWKDVVDPDSSLDLVDHLVQSFVAMRV